MTLVMQAVRRDDPVQILKRREADGGLRRRIRGAVASRAPDDAGFERRRPPIGRAHHAGAGLFLPTWDVGRNIGALVFSLRADHGSAGGKSEGSGQQLASGGASSASRLRGVGLRAVGLFSVSQGGELFLLAIQSLTRVDANERRLAPSDNS